MYQIDKKNNIKIYKRNEQKDDLLEVVRVKLEMAPYWSFLSSMRCLIWYIFARDEGHMKRYKMACKQNTLSNHASEFSKSTTIFIYKVSYICLTYKRPISHPPPPWSDHRPQLWCIELCSYSHTIRQLEKRYNDKTMTVLVDMELSICYICSPSASR